MKKELLELIQEEINLLEKWVAEVKSGGWSTNLVQPMKNRILELKSKFYDIQKQ